MRTAIVYVSKNGTTKATIDRIVKSRPLNTDIIDASVNTDFRGAAYQRVIFGCGIYGGKLQQDLVRFVKKHHQDLIKAEVHFFIHGLLNKQDVTEVLSQSIEHISKLNVVNVHSLGGYLDIKTQNFFVKTLLGVLCKKENLDINNLNTLSEARTAQFIDSL